MRMNRVFQWVITAGAVFFVGAALSTAKEPEKAAAAKRPISYYKEIRPIFQANCQGCHQPAKAKGDYVMTDFAKLLAGGNGKEKAIVPGSPNKSLLIKEITPVKGEAEMPKGKKPLAESDIELISQWITQGAKNDTPANAIQRYSAENLPVYTRPPVITSVDYSPDGQYIAVSGFHEVLLHKADGSGISARLVGMAERIESARFSPDGKWLAVTGGQPGRMGEVQVWDVETRKLSLSVPVTFDTVYGASWSPDGTLIAFGCADNTVRAIDAKTGEQVFYQGAHNDWVFDTAFDVKGEHLISVGRDMTAKLTEFKSQRFIDNITSITPGALKGGYSAVSRHPERDEVLMGGSDGEPQIFRIFRTTKRVIGDNANLIKKFPAMPGRIFSVNYSRDGNRFVAGSSLDGKGEVVVFGANMPGKVPPAITAILKKRVAQQTPAEKEELRKFQTEGIQLITKIALPTTGVYAVAFHPDSNVIAVGGSDGKIRLYDSDKSSLIKEFVLIDVALTKPSTVPATTSIPNAIPQLTPLINEGHPKGTTVTAIEAEPTSIRLGGRHEYSQTVVMARLSTGDLIDVTRLAKFSVTGALAEVTAAGSVRPKKNGEGTIKISYEGKTVTLPITVAGAQSAQPVDYIRDVMPITSRLGCNAGTCHGAKDGKNGFKLSLRGYDPIYDVRAFTDDLAQRRINVASPDDSLMLLKATGAVPHTGGQVTRLGENYYQILRDWIAGGAKLDLTTPRVIGIELTPKNPVVQQVGARQQMRIIATYANGTKRDVTSESFVESGNTDVAKSEGSLVNTFRRGEAPVLARFEGAYAATTITVMGDRTGFAWQDPASWSRIDELAAAKWKRMKILPSDICSDEEFLRRAHLDLTGLPPSTDEIRAFYADTRETRIKRDAIIDKLIGSESYIEHWSNKWADLLQVNRKFLGAEGAAAFRMWIRNEVSTNTPYNEFARKIVTATGSNKDNPPVSYYKILRTAPDIMENTTHLFLATRFNCNKCHDHPFERWTQDQYYQTAAFFAQVGLKKDPASGDKNIGGTAVEGAKPLYEIIEDLKSGEINHDRTGVVTPPVFPYSAQHAAKQGAPRREILAEWITSPDNQYFARSYVNRMWGYLTGVGIIEPIDDIRAGNPPSNPDLLDWLAQDFIKNGFNVRHLIATICKSRTYQLSLKSNRWNVDDKINYSHATARRLPAEVLYDSIYFTTGAKLRIPGVPEGTRAAALPDVGINSADGFLGNLGRPARESACECERGNDLRLGPIMALISGPTVGDAISDPANAIAKIVATETDDNKVVNELYLRILNRTATATEIQSALKHMRVIDEEHKTLTAEMDAYQKKLAPITAQKESARVAATNTAFANLTDYEKEIAPREAALDAQQKTNIAKADAILKAYETTLPAKQVEWEKSPLKGSVWSVLEPMQMKSSFNATLTKETDSTIFVTGAEGRGTYEITAETTLMEITGIRLEALTDKRLPQSGPGRSPDGNFVLTEFEVSWAPKANPTQVKKVKLDNAKADFSQESYSVKTAIDGLVPANLNGWAISPQVSKNHISSYEFTEKAASPNGIILTITLNQQFNSAKHSLGKFRLAITGSAKPVEFGVVPNIDLILAIEAAKRTDAQKAELLKYFREQDAALKQNQTALADAQKPRAIDPKLTELRGILMRASLPLSIDSKLKELTRDMELSTQQLPNRRLISAQDLAWALINNPAFLFNH